MPKLKTRLPKLCRDRKLAISWHNGERVYHGLWGTHEAEKTTNGSLPTCLKAPQFPCEWTETPTYWCPNLPPPFWKATSPEWGKSTT